MSVVSRKRFFKAVMAMLFVCCISVLFGTKNVAAEEEFDLTNDWNVISYGSSLKEPLEDILSYGRIRPGTDIHYVSVGFSNIGRANLTMEKKLRLKAGKTYHINLLYGLYTDEDASAFVDFNGVKKESTKTDTQQYLDQKYSEVITPTVDQDYVITMSFSTPAFKEVFVMVGYDPSAGGGIKEEKLDKPNVKTPEACSKTVSGWGTTGNTIKVMDSSGQVVGTGVVDSANEFTIETTRELAYEEVLSVTQVSKTNNEESEATLVTVDDTIKPDQPIIKAIRVEDQAIDGSAEANSKITVTDKKGEVLGESYAAADGAVSFVLTKAAVLNESVIVTATDQAGNVSDPVSVSVYTDLVTEDPIINDSDNVLSAAKKAGDEVLEKEQTQNLPHTSEKENAPLFTLTGVLISVSAVLWLKYKQRGEHSNEF